ncbi:nitrate regulatory gene2 protein [Impatiens glandulifera]|uniref:nitrate regulatory gene2 protein n=1 Tax=Impatiens glandulifera TaxID=253017 RepID=UPI001FB08928|nr:nitrate regulatory gene2 protein [Impatiens glandulifera]
MTATVFCFAELGFLAAEMGCGGSKVDDLALVVRCKQRKELIMAAAGHRYALAAAHVSYFKSLERVGDALRKFVQEELVIVSPPPSPGPVLTLPSDELKPKKRHVNDNSSPSSGSDSNSQIHSLGDRDHDHDHDHDHHGSHLHLSDSDSELSSPSVHVQHHNHPHEETMPPFSGAFPQTNWGPYGINFPNLNPAPSWESSGMNPYPPLQPGWDPYNNNYGNGMSSTNYHTYYMKKSAPAVQTVIHDPNNSHESVQLPESSHNMYPSYPYQNGGDFFRFPTGAPYPSSYRNKPPSPLPEPPPPPSPNVSSWDFLNPFDTFDHGYAGYYSQNNIYENGSIVSSPEINEVREREGIPDLEDETDPEVIKEVVHKKGKKVYEGVRKRSGVGTTSRSVQSRKKSSESSSSSMPFHKQSSHGFPSQSSSEGISVEPSSLHSESAHSVNLKEEKSSPETILSKSSEDISTKKREVTFDDGIQDSSSTFTAHIYRAHGTRDLNDVVQEIENEFKTASAVGKEVASMLEVGKLSYQPRVSLLKVILSRVNYVIAPTISYSTDPPSRRSVSTRRLAESYLTDSENTKTINLSSTLDKLYAWEKKLYKEVKDEERLRLIYEKRCRRLKSLDDEGAESSKIEATQASIKKLLMKIDVCIKAVNAISTRIHKLRDEELQPQVTELVHGLTRMWRGMVKCHQKQFQAIMDSKMKKLRSNAVRRDSSLKATMELEVELRTWCNHFCDWMHNQRSFIVSLNAWLLRCLDYEPEESSDGIVPFSPGRIGAPPIFVVCNDWFQAMETISEKGVTEAVDKFGSILGQLWAMDEDRDKKREESLKELERRLQSVRLNKKAKSEVPSESGILPLDDLKVDLDSMRKKLQEDSISLQANLVPIFECLGNFASEALKAYENVRTPNAK